MQVAAQLTSSVRTGAPAPVSGFFPPASSIVVPSRAASPRPVVASAATPRVTNAVCWSFNTSTPAPSVLPPAMTSLLPTAPAAAPWRGVVSVSARSVPSVPMRSTFEVGSPVLRVAPTMNEVPSARVTVSPPATSPKVRPSGAGASAVASLEKSSHEAPASSIVRSLFCCDARAFGCARERRLRSPSCPRWPRRRSPVRSRRRRATDHRPRRSRTRGTPRSRPVSCGGARAYRGGATTRRCVRRRAGP